jgi:hypothetical protein
MPLSGPANTLQTTGGPVNVGQSGAPSVGQILVATAADAATWQSPGAATSTLKQTAFAEIAVDTTTTSTSFVDLLTISFTITASSIVLISFTASVSNTPSSTRNQDFRITIDGVAKRGARAICTTGSSATCAAIVLRVTGLAAGARSIKVQWKTSASTAQIRPVAAPDTEHASLLVQEVTV